MADDVILYKDLTVSVRDRGESYEAGFVIDGAFFAFAQFKPGGFKEDLAEGQAEAADGKTTGKK